LKTPKDIIGYWWTHNIAGGWRGLWNKLFNLLGHCWTTICPWSQAGHSVQAAVISLKSQNRWQCCHSWTFQTWAWSQYCHHLDHMLVTLWAQHSVPLIQAAVWFKMQQKWRHQKEKEKLIAAMVE
jgi:hypothetical protein